MALEDRTGTPSDRTKAPDSDVSASAPQGEADLEFDAEAPRRALTATQAAAVQAAAASRAARRGVAAPIAPPAVAQTIEPSLTPSPTQAASITVQSDSLKDSEQAMPQAQDLQTQEPQKARAQVKASRVVATSGGAAEAAASTAAPAEVEQRARKTPSARRGVSGSVAAPLAERPAASSRVLTALVGIPIVIGIVWLGGAWIVGVTFLLALIAMRELVVAARRNRTPLVIEWAYPLLLLVFFAFLRVGAHLLKDLHPTATPNIGNVVQRPFFTVFAPFALFAALIALLVFAIARYAKPKPVTLISVALTLLSTLYVSLLVFLPLVQGRPQGRYLIWIVLFGVWSGDTAAYYAGRAWGRHKLTPLSPGKSREGLWASVLTTIAVCAGLAAATPLGWMDGLFLGALIAVFAPLGDLAESFWKRELNVKDLGSILPGHGGVLDRCDSLMFAAPAAYLYALWQAL